MRVMRNWQLGVLCALVVGASSGPRAGADIDFFRELLEQKVTTVDDGCRAILLVLERPVPEKPRERLRAVEKLGLLPRDLDRDPMGRFTAGMLGYLVCKATGLRGGLTMRISGVSERYGLKECVARKWIGPGPTYRSVSGGELLSVLRRIEDEVPAAKGAKGKEGGKES